jgi:hypothetical protein
VCIVVTVTWNLMFIYFVYVYVYVYASCNQGSGCLYQSYQCTSTLADIFSTTASILLLLFIVIVTQDYVSNLGFVFSFVLSYPLSIIHEC